MGEDRKVRHVAINGRNLKVVPLDARCIKDLFVSGKLGLIAGSFIRF